MTALEAKQVIQACNGPHEDGFYRAGDCILVNQVMVHFRDYDPHVILGEMEALGYVEYVMGDGKTRISGYRLTLKGAELANS